MYIWQKVPVSRVFIPFLTGVLLAIEFPIDFNRNIYFIAGSIGLISLFFISTSRIKSYDLEKYRGFFITLIFTSLVFLYTSSKVQINNTKHFSNYIENNDYALVRLIEIPVEKTKTVKTTVQVQKVFHEDGETQKTYGKLIIYLKKHMGLENLNYGDLILIKANYQEIASPGNPGQFNYKRFLYYKQIYHQAFLDSSDYKIYKHAGSGILRNIYNLRYKIIDILKEDIKGDDKTGIATALLVGYKTELSDQVKESFAATGAMHVLAVSGLHVGIIFLVFNSIFLRLRKRKKGKLLHFFIMASILWIYAILTGFSPSVIRAATMFTFVLIGQNIGRITNVYASILASAMFILLIDPFLITQVGFQLSYAAVLGIVFLQPLLYNQLKFRFWLWDKAWQLACVSIAAQLATFPISLMYFNQFPVYFLISNFIVIPAATAIIYVGFTFLIFKFIGLGIVATIFSMLLNGILWLLNFLILKIRELPGGLITEVYFDYIKVFAIYGFILLTVLWLLRKKNSLLIWSAIMVLVFMADHALWTGRNHSQKRMVIYSIRDYSLFGFYNGNDITFIGDQQILDDYYQLKYNTFRDIWHHGQKAENVGLVDFDSTIHHSNLYFNQNLIQFNNKSILIVKKDFDLDKINDLHHFNLIVLTDNIYMDLNKLNQKITSDLIVIDASNNYWKRDYWQKQADELQISCYDVSKNGALEINL
jgi:competence protein ComEC